MNKIDEIKSKGNAALEAKKYDEAIDYYTQAITLDPLNHILFGNRSAVYIKQEKYKEALDDALKTIQLKNDWSKGYFRKATALKYLKRFDDAINAFVEALKIDPTNQELKKEVSICKVILKEQSIKT